MCGLHCIYAAHVIVSPNFAKDFEVNGHDMMRFANKWCYKFVILMIFSNDLQLIFFQNCFFLLDHLPLLISLPLLKEVKLNIISLTTEHLNQSLNNHTLSKNYQGLLRTQKHHPHSLC